MVNMGGRPPETADREYLRLFVDTDDPVLFTSEIAEAVGVTQQGAFKRLAQLREQGFVDAKKGEERVWWLTDRGRERTER